MIVKLHTYIVIKPSLFTSINRRVPERDTVSYSRPFSSTHCQKFDDLKRYFSAAIVFPSSFTSSCHLKLVLLPEFTLFTYIVRFIQLGPVRVVEIEEMVPPHHLPHAVGALGALEGPLVEGRRLGRAPEAPLAC